MSNYYYYFSLFYGKLTSLYCCKEIKINSTSVYLFDDINLKFLLFSFYYKKNLNKNSKREDEDWGGSQGFSRNVAGTKSHFQTFPPITTYTHYIITNSSIFLTFPLFFLSFKTLTLDRRRQSRRRRRCWSWGWFRGAF